MQTERNTELMFQQTKSIRLVTDYPKPRPKEDYMHPWYTYKDTIPNSILNLPITLIM